MVGRQFWLANQQASPAVGWPLQSDKFMPCLLESSRPAQKAETASPCRYQTQQAPSQAGTAAMIW